MITLPVTGAERKSRKFLDISHYDHAGNYHLLPFRFVALRNGREVLVNEIGDFLIVDKGTARRIINRKLDPFEDSELYADLIANFFISQTRVPALLEVIATRYRTKKSFLDHFTALHIFVITLRCEHTCHYCQVSRVSEDKDTFDMGRTHIDKGIELMMRSSNPHVTMEFQGGEALLAFDQIMYAVQRASAESQKIGKQISFVICTNLAPLKKEMLDFCLKYKIIISTSLDGPEFLHNKNRHKKRNDSYQLAISGIRKCREILGNDAVSALTTTSTLSLDYPHEIVGEYINLGFNSIFLRPISPFGFAVKNDRKNKYDTDRFLEFYKKGLDLIIEHNLNGNFFREDYASIILKKILSPFPVGYVDLQSPAGMINNVIVFNYDGYIYASDEARMLAEMKDYTFQLGHLDTAGYEDIFYGEKAFSFAESSVNESLPGCSDCAFQTYCGSDPVLNHSTQGNLIGHRPTSVFCQKNMGIISHLFELIDSDERILKIFNNWIEN
ncbi:His-Xaa-Ser system radical SAM maturase HxsB [Pedobacter sp. AK013]|uniref:His-Xaa-Ser system radical SAM maturase HxsB n=1 Tax=Pedobacter sp. AK013 TaxID=2723071 RepID=UPI00161DFD03|nr:His-Xaa-Ser system radical SAM maturase HxsB [Pedobacter sp. AK013]MBB6239956.1 His-Xaa-Ser system radical SAM maturase HxsB [Pedobacter sp. AK013]